MLHNSHHPHYNGHHSLWIKGSLKFAVSHRNQSQLDGRSAKGLKLLDQIAYIGTVVIISQSVCISILFLQVMSFTTL
jgi:hypothetical protein